MLLGHVAEAVFLKVASEGAGAFSVRPRRRAGCSPHAVMRMAGSVEPTVFFFLVGKRKLLKTGLDLREAPVTPTKL